MSIVLQNLYIIYCKKNSLYNRVKSKAQTLTHGYYWRRHVCVVSLTLSSKVPTFVSMEPPICCITSRCANEITTLLSPPSPHQLQVFNLFIHLFHQPIFIFSSFSSLFMQEYYQNIFSSRHCNDITVKHDDQLGKGDDFIHYIICLCSITPILFYFIVHVVNC